MNQGIQKIICVFLWLNFSLLFPAVTFSQITDTAKTDSVKILKNFTPKQKVTWGIRAGLSLAQISGAGAQGFNKFGFTGGPFLDYRFAKKWSFKPELLYTMKGSRRNPDPDNGDYESYDISLDYIEIPTVFNFHFDWRDRFVFEFGPVFGILVREYILFNQGELNEARGFNPFELSLTAGFNFQFHRHWQFFAKFTNSIIPIRPTVSGQTVIMPIWGIVNIGQVSSAFSVGLQYRFQKKDPNAPKKEKTPKPKKQRGDVIDED